MIQKIVTALLLLSFTYLEGRGQKIVVDTASTSKYLITKERSAPKAPAAPAVQEELSFGERALSIGNGILNRLKARLNLEEAAETLKAKKESIVGSGTRKEEEEDQGGG